MQEKSPAETDFNFYTAMLTLIGRADETAALVVAVRRQDGATVVLSRNLTG